MSSQQSAVSSETTFRGYRRADGRAGIRNLALVLPTSVCATKVAEDIARAVPGAVAAHNEYGCCQVGGDLRLTVKTLIHAARNPNVGAVLLIGLGCEGIAPDALAGEIAGTPVATLTIQEAGGSVQATARGIETVRGFVAELAGQAREAVPVGELILGLECGGSDTTSGLAANPALGAASDVLIAAGGTCILSETTECIGAEHVLARRAVNAAVAEEILRIVQACEDRALAMGEDLRGSQPTPGNIAGGITTIEEKSLGCLHKAGTAPVQGVLGFADVPPGRGLYLMDTPGMDVLSMTGTAAGGAQVMVFTTGRGTPAGNAIMPVIKATANARTARHMAENIDVDLSGILDGSMTIEDGGRLLLETILRVANGEPTKAELLGHCEFSLERIGPTF